MQLNPRIEIHCTLKSAHSNILQTLIRIIFFFMRRDLCEIKSAPVDTL
jgi:hypothetical protein